MKKTILFLSIFSLFLTFNENLARAQDQSTLNPDKASFDDSLNKTQSLLKTPSERNKAIQETAEGRKADDRVKSLAPDDKTQQEYYELAADIMNNYREEKDEDAMKKSVEAGGRDPSAFLNGLTPEQKAKVKALGEKLSPASGQTNP